ncbi:LacI family DNA-binding transcriptional regulator [Grimontia marina]|uniref:HTH-type transcriptional regulator GntR n=1 Tax=Grimontia marina TaxID=646534 RepID=A0A128F920_9GAMM|nr:LacI family DNA-binding transcriptional regulator [Grimontia marina]CZF83000.1 HTH-type transcriptional regulator GntR [Grimontia marina]
MKYKQAKQVSGVRRRGRVRIEVVAELAGVSAMTVSRVLSSPEKVSEKTREKVWQVINETGYVPNYSAKNLASNTSRIVAVVVPTLQNSIFADMVEGLASELELHGYQLLLGNSDYSAEREFTLVKEFISKQPVGIVLTGFTHLKETIDLIHHSDITVTETWNSLPPNFGKRVGFSNYDACYQMVKHLVGRNYQKIGFVSAPVHGNDRARARRQGFIDAMSDSGLGVEASWLKESDFSFSNGAALLQAFWREENRPEVIFFANDVLAAGAVFECQRMGLSIPADIGIVGFDDLDIASQCSPQLTTVRVPTFQIGRIAARQLLGMKDMEDDIVDLSFDIVQRQSSR